jgi:DNA-binding response OmpR family regulator
MIDEAADLAGLRILVVEDTLLVAEAICDFLEDCGSVVVGPAARLEAALVLARDEQIDGALLDVNLAGELSFPVAQALEARQVPCVFLTGYGDNSLFPSEFHAKPRILKPFHYASLARTLAQQFAKPR